MADDVSVTFGAKIEGAMAGIAALTEAIEEISNPIKAISGSFGELKEAIAGALAIEAIRKVSDFVESFAALGAQTERTAALLGVSASQVSGFGLMAQASGGTLQELTGAVERLGLNLARADAGSQQARAALNALGISAKQLEALPLEGKMELLAQKFSVLKDGSEKDAIAMALLGRAGANMIPIFNEGAQAIGQFQTMADRAGSGMGGEQLAAANRLHVGLLELGASWIGLSNSIATAFEPAISGAIRVITDMIERFNRAINGSGALGIAMTVAADSVKFLVTAFAEASAAVQTLWEFVKLGVTNMANEFMALGKIIYSAFTLNLDGIKSAWNELQAANIASSKATSQNLSEIYKSLQAELIETWNSAADEHTQIEQTKVARLKEIDKDYVNSQLKDIDGQIKALQEGLKTKTALYNEEANTFQITQNQKFAALEQETQAEFLAEMDLLNQKAKIAGQTVEQQRQVANQIKELWAKHNLDMVNLDKESIAQQQQQWTSFLNTIESSFNSQLRGLLAGTTTWSQAFKTMCGDMIIKFIEMCEQMVVKWTAAQLAQTTAATTGAATRAAAEQTAADSGVLANAARAVQNIMQDAAQTFAGVFAFLAPTMGPAAVGPAAAAQASVSAAAIFETGTDYVVRGGLALIHPGETIIPARGSGPYTGAHDNGMSATIKGMLSAHLSQMSALHADTRKTNRGLWSAVDALHATIKKKR